MLPGQSMTSLPHVQYSVVFRSPKNKLSCVDLATGGGMSVTGQGKCCGKWA